MKNIGFINSNYPGEKRVALLPKDVSNIKTYDNIYVQKDYAKNLGINDCEYEQKGCIIAEKEKIYENCNVISHLKLIQKSDYKFLKDDIMLIGWTHPNGSGKEFTKFAHNKGIIIVDLDNIYPAIYMKNKKIDLREYIKPNFIKNNSVNAGRAAVLNALTTYGIYPNGNLKAAILSAGNVSQGANEVLTKFGVNTRIFTRSNMNDFIEEISQYDIIVSGIEFSNNERPIITEEISKKIKKDALVIDAAADSGNVIENMTYTDFKNPLKKHNNCFYWCINNIPSQLFRTASYDISESFSKTYDIDYLKIIKESENNG